MIVSAIVAKDKHNLIGTEKCDFCEINGSVGCFSTHLPISLNYCQKCLDVYEIRTNQNVIMNYKRNGDKYLDNGFTTFYNGEYLHISDFIKKQGE